jgi:hypothetical protein
MRNFTVFVDEMTDRTQPAVTPCFLIALTPSSRSGGAMATKQYSTREDFVVDL